MKGYQQLVSPMLGKRCRFYPTCSSYAIESIENFGVMLGLVKTIQRLCKCHPFHRGGVDYPVKPNFEKENKPI